MHVRVSRWLNGVYLPPNPCFFPVLNILFTHPDYRRMGVGTLIISWGLEQADRLGLECFVEGTKEGKPCYERFGFKVVEENALHSEKEDPDEEWKTLEKALLPFTWWSMRRDAKAS